jgi:hypothetical protein
MAHRIFWSIAIFTLALPVIASFVDTPEELAQAKAIQWCEAQGQTDRYCVKDMTVYFLERG